jgi:hypothetical protein
MILKSVTRLSDSITNHRVGDIVRRLFVPLIIALLAVTVSTNGSPRGWLVKKTSGEAVYGAQSAALTKGVVLDRGATMRTGNNGKVLLVRSAESVFIGPYTVAAIAVRPTNGLDTTVLLQSGQAQLSVRKRNSAHLSVETPYLVAVVKGTKFNVAVGRNSAQVLVQEGRVAVKALRSGRSVDVSAGQKVVVDAAGNLTLTGKGTLATIKSGTPRAAAVSAGSTSASVNSSVGSQGTASVGVSAGTGDLSVGGSSSVGGVGVSAGASIGGTGASVGGSVSVGSSQLGGGIGIGGL